MSTVTLSSYNVERGAYSLPPPEPACWRCGEDRSSLRCKEDCVDEPQNRRIAFEDEEDVERVRGTSADARCGALARVTHYQISSEA